MILIGLGSNLGSASRGPPLAIVAAALAALPAMRMSVASRSGWYHSEPVPASDQPWFVNGVAVLETGLSAEALLERLLSLEQDFGRIRGVRNAARVLDLDLLDYHGRVVDTPALVLPHPRLHQRRFVLMPLAEVAPRWRHPTLGVTAAELLARLPPGERVSPIGG